MCHQPNLITVHLGNLTEYTSGCLKARTLELAYICDKKLFMHPSRPDTSRKLPMEGVDFIVSLSVMNVLV